MAPLYSDFLSKHFSQLIKFGYGFLNPSSAWASPAFCVPKSGANRSLQSVCDLRVSNSMMKRLSYPMPHLLSLGEYLSESAVFFTLDAFKGFWQIPISGDVESQSMSTPIGIFTPNRLPQGNLNSVFIFQHAMDTIFRPTISSNELLIWIDDLFGHGPDPSSLLRTLRAVFELCRKFRLKLNAARCNFFLLEAKWCGKIYFRGGWNHDPARTSALRSMAQPRTAGDLMQFVCACTWLSSHIPDFARTIHPLRILLESLLKQSKDRSKSSARRIIVPVELWDESVSVAFGNMLTALDNCVNLSHPRADMERCVFHDSSGDFCSVIITQVSTSELSKPVAEQTHEPLAFYSKAFYWRCSPMVRARKGGLRAYRNRRPL